MTEAPVWPIDPTSPESAMVGLGAHADLWQGSMVVGLGWTARTVRQLHVIANGLARVLVERDGFEAVLIEGDRAMSKTLDTFVRTGAGDPQAALARSRPFLATQELLNLVMWVRHHNDRNRARPVRLVHGGADDLSSPAALEQSLAAQLIAWHEDHGDRIVWLGGVAHTAVDPRRSLSGSAGEVPTAGSVIRAKLGARYFSVGLTFGSGAIPEHVPRPRPTSLEARLDTVAHPTFLLDPNESFGATWHDGTDGVRLVGPDYDPDHDAEHAMTGDPRRWFDLLVHQKIATSVQFLT